MGLVEWRRRLYTCQIATSSMIMFECYPQRSERGGVDNTLIAKIECEAACATSTARRTIGGNTPLIQGFHRISRRARRSD